MLCEDGGKIVPADGLRPALEKGFDLSFIGVGLFKHDWTPCYDPRTNEGWQIRQRRLRSSGG
jgi:hypothetical protein